MKCITTINGKMSLVIVPETELDKKILQEIFKVGVECQYVEKVQILDKALQDSVIITPRIEPKTEQL